ncbi:ABC transporter ATP-binding protein [Paractinoplanes brasiliensis]|uniref:ABC-2 type transport system ATP-binding protein n=1 Tax=Paractinoplanes brasiliensis TaxID=52695 RepID=A0A4R6JWG4_9ACTN|nr:ABC transporter ATP-binding protein [Actinoplanes brasiliensis]TDO40637.1 ABC-2 type transport system ATP-binding protein [Actinoplanes brasiliensis]GID25706.1 ABC transporter [Actinoplanes brasiliensis]
MIELRGVTVRYGSTLAVDNVDLELPTGSIYGLLGRNGSGKTSLLSVLASYRRPSSGTVLIDGEEAFENPRITRRTSFIRDTLDLSDSDRISTVLAVAGWLRPGWDAEYAGKLLDTFELSPRRRVSGLSRGQRSMLGATLGLATRAPLTILDETYLGMDAVARTLFYRELLDDYLAHPRTIVLSTHLIEEVAELFERVIIMDRGRILLHDETDALRGRGVTVTGPAELVTAFAAGHTVLGEHNLGGVRALTLDGRLDPDEIARGERDGLSFGPLGLQELFVHLTSQPRPLEASR